MIASLLTAAVLLATVAADATTDAPGAAVGPGVVADDPATLVDGLGIRFVLVPAGRFEMGSPVDEPGRRPKEGPRHPVEIERSFWIADRETTVAQFRRFVDATGYVTEAERDADGGFGIDFDTGDVVQDAEVTWRDPGFPPSFRQGDDHPVIVVSWQDADAFCRWMSEREGATYRLPTEAEWEHAARGGTTTRWWFGDDEADLVRHANVGDRALARAAPAFTNVSAGDDGHAFTAPAGAFPANPFGLHGVHGNAWEWCADWHRDDWYRDRPGTSSAGPPAGDFRVIRGGGWLDPPARTRAAQRIWFGPTFRYCLLSGFRVVREVAAGDARSAAAPEAR